MTARLWHEPVAQAIRGVRIVQVGHRLVKSFCSLATAEPRTLNLQKGK
jgi:hypothetical protein